MVAIFFTTLAICQVLAGYICARGIYCITKLTWLGVIVVLLSVIVPFSIYSVHRSLREDWLWGSIIHFGYIYQGFVLYFSMFCIGAFIFFRFNSTIDQAKVMLIGLALTIAILILGYFNAMYTRLKKITIPSDRDFKMCFVSDIHVGSINCLKILDNTEKLIEKCNPDVVVLGGDTLDLGGKKYSEKLSEAMQRITSKYKTYSVVGNHEVYAGVQDCIELQKNAGIEMLLDTSMTLENGFTIVGRLDRTFYWRKKLKDLVPEDKSHLIVVDHAPDMTQESIDNEAILHLSGHTHGGQMFPINLVTNLLYGPTGVLKKIRNTYCYISSGVGFWGPPYRIGNSPEVHV